jgi:phosphotriesterase-related protein
VQALDSLLQGDESDVFVDAGYQGPHKRPDAKEEVTWHVAMRPGKRRALNRTQMIDRITDEAEKIKASIRAKVEHPLRVIKRQFRHVKVRYRGGSSPQTRRPDGIRRHRSRIVYSKTVGKTCSTRAEEEVVMSGFETSRPLARVNTVCGPIAATDLGMTLMHEHLVVDWTKRMGEPPEGEARQQYHARVDASMHWLLADNPACCLDNARFDDMESMVEELGNFAAAGGRTIVECSNADIGRDPLALREISKKSGLNIIMGSGWYVHAFHDAEQTVLGVDALCKQLIAEFEDGADDTGIKPGIIGEIGVSPLFTEGERIRLRAAARAQRQLKVPMLIHMPGWQRRAHEVLDIVLKEEGVASEAVVLCHMDPSGEDVEYQRAVAARGVWLEFDMIGMPNYYPGEGQSPSPDQTAKAISGLVRDGHAARILLSHDLAMKSMWTRNGGNGVGYIPRLFLSRLERHGVSLSAAADMMTVNPFQLFSVSANS